MLGFIVSESFLFDLRKYGWRQSFSGDLNPPFKFGLRNLLIAYTHLIAFIDLVTQFLHFFEVHLIARLG